MVLLCALLRAASTVPLFNYCLSAAVVDTSSNKTYLKMATSTFMPATLPASCCTAFRSDMSHWQHSQLQTCTSPGSAAGWQHHKEGSDGRRQLAADSRCCRRLPALVGGSLGRISFTCLMPCMSSATMMSFLAPWRARQQQSTSPTPREAPVTMTVLPDSRLSPEDAMVG